MDIEGAIRNYRDWFCTVCGDKPMCRCTDKFQPPAKKGCLNVMLQCSCGKILDHNQPDMRIEPAPAGPADPDPFVAEVRARGLIRGLDKESAEDETFKFIVHPNQMAIPEIKALVDKGYAIVSEKPAEQGKLSEELPGCPNCAPCKPPLPKVATLTPLPAEVEERITHIPDFFGGFRGTPIASTYPQIEDWARKLCELMRDGK